jgi:uncharacterized RDD family membrane protein YckC
MVGRVGTLREVPATPDDRDDLPDWSSLPPPPPPPPEPPHPREQWPPPGGAAGWQPPPGGPAAPNYGSPGIKGYTPWGMAGGWWRRVGATVVDSLVLLVPNYVIGGVSSIVLGTILSLAISATYATVMVTRNGQTVGNRAASTRVVDAATGGPIPAPRAFGRWACYASLQIGLLLTLVYGGAAVALFAIVYLVDLLWPLWDARNQTLHDKVVGTLVVQTFR